MLKKKKMKQIPLFSDRKTHRAPKFQLRVSDKKGAEFTVQARTNLLIEHAQVSSKKVEGTLSALYEHYGTQQSSFSKLRARWQQTCTTESAKRKGRPSLLDAVAEKELRDATRENRRAPPKLIKLSVKGSSGGGNYRGEKKEHVSRSTIYNWKEKIGYVGRGIKIRPIITPKNAVERKAYAKELIKAKDEEHTRLKVDEKWFTVPGLSGKLNYHPDSDEEDVDHYKSMQSKSHPEQIMVIAGVAKPVLKQGWTAGEEFWDKTGKVFIARCRRNIACKRGRKQRGDDGQILRGPAGLSGGRGPELYEHKAGTLLPVDVLDKGSGGLDGELYADMWTGGAQFPGTGLLEIADEYGGLEVIQEDGAPGHGYRNKAEGKPPTEHHDRFTDAAEEMGFIVERQPANSPELNDCDLGMWWALDSAKELRYKEFLPSMSREERLDKLWECVEDAWEDLDPEKLFSIAEHKVDVAAAIVLNEGRQLKEEPHAGARQRTKHAIAAARSA
jgi:hypothetical protein